MPHPREREADVRLSESQLCFEKHMKELGYLYEREYQFYSKRKWRADYLIFRNPHAAKHPQSYKMTALVEIEGSVWTQGRHTRGSGFSADLIKYNMAAACGYTLFRFSTEMILRGEAKEFIAKYL